ncbi:MAG: hypothetical protein IT303_17275 [Dehalococcoidia bacterium]|nr:hypothetical protein [Dehalococcoidia bacterium]
MLSFRKFSVRRRVERLLRDGIGLHECTWDVPDRGRELDELVSPIVEWTRREMGEMRRPNGIDQVALALACRDPHGRVVCSNSFGVVRPSMFYTDEGRDRIAAFLADVESVPGEGRYEVVAALLSLGDIAYELSHAQAA